MYFGDYINFVYKIKSFFKTLLELVKKLKFLEFHYQQKQLKSLDYILHFQHEDHLVLNIDLKDLNKCLAQLKIIQKKLLFYGMFL